MGNLRKSLEKIKFYRDILVNNTPYKESSYIIGKTLTNNLKEIQQEYLMNSFETEQGILNIYKIFEHKDSKTFVIHKNDSFSIATVDKSQELTKDTALSVLDTWDSLELDYILEVYFYEYNSTNNKLWLKGHCKGEYVEGDFHIAKNCDVTFKLENENYIFWTVYSFKDVSEVQNIDITKLKKYIQAIHKESKFSDRNLYLSVKMHNRLDITYSNFPFFYPREVIVDRNNKTKEITEHKNKKVLKEFLEEHELICPIKGLKGNVELQELLELNL